MSFCNDKVDLYIRIYSSTSDKENIGKFKYWKTVANWDRLKFRGDGELGQLSKITMVRSNNENHFAAENLISTDCVIKRCASSYEHELKKTFFRTSNINEIEREERERENNDIKFLPVC